MGCCRGWHHATQCGGTPWRYERTPLPPPPTQRRLRREELEDYLDYLKEELRRVRDELEEASNQSRPTRIGLPGHWNGRRDRRCNERERERDGSPAAAGRDL